VILARVIGNVWSTRKEDSLRGLKFLIVQPLTVQEKPGGGQVLADAGNTIIAGDKIGAGESEIVMVTAGSSARQSLADTHTPVDAMIVGIIDKETFGI
jgi:ethanolamine utilization protein EutN